MNSNPKSENNVSQWQESDADQWGNDFNLGPNNSSFIFLSFTSRQDSGLKSFSPRKLGPSTKVLTDSLNFHGVSNWNCGAILCDLILIYPVWIISKNIL